MANEIPDTISIEQFNAAPDAVPNRQIASLDEGTPDTISIDQFNAAEDDEDKYGTPEQQVKAGLEGAGRGIAGPLATMAETKLLGVDPKAIEGRREANPITSGVGEAAGLVGSTALIPGLGAGMELAGRGAVEAIGLAAPKAFAERVGSAAVKAAVETAVYQASDEASKMIIDPKITSEQAIANIGLAAALGGTGGAFITGAVSPLWKATAGDRLNTYLHGFKDHLNGFGKTLPEDIAAAESTLGISLTPEIKGAAISPKGAQYYNDLKSSQSSVIRQGEETLKRDASESVAQALGKPIEDFQNYDTATAGREGIDTFIKEYKAKAEPVIKEFNSLTEPFKNSQVLSDDIADLSNKISTLAQERSWIGQDIPQQKIVDGVMNRLQGLKTAADIKRLMTTVDNIAMDNPQALSRPAREMKKLILEAQQDVLGRGIQDKSQDLFSKYVNARRAYADLASVSDEAGSNLSIGRFSGPEGFLTKLTEKRTPEEFFKKLSPEGNAEIIPFLETHFPNTLERVKDNEFKKIVAPAIRAAKEGESINIKTLQNAIERKMAGQDQFAKFILPEELIKKTEAANYLIKKAIPGIKDSGTAGWLERKMKGIPAGAIGMVSWLTGHNPVVGAMLGGLGEFAQKKVPEAYKLAMLRFISSDQPIKSEGFKAAVDMIHSAVRAQVALQKASQSIFIPGVAVLASNQIPDKKDNDKLDKMITEYQDAPDKMFQLTKGDVGHYFPEHQTGLAETATQQIQYLQALKPKPFRAGPLDKPIEPSDAEMARYNRALSIANQPMIVLEHVKKGTVQLTDLQDLKAMYPALYDKMAGMISNDMINRHADEEPIPYDTRMGISLFLAQPIDSSMTPSSIMSAQPKTAAPPARDPGAVKPTQNGMNKLGKSNKMHMTPNQSSEFHRLDKR